MTSSSGKNVTPTFFEAFGGYLRRLGLAGVVDGSTACGSPNRVAAVIEVRNDAPETSFHQWSFWPTFSWRLMR